MKILEWIEDNIIVLVSIVLLIILFIVGINSYITRDKCRDLGGIIHDGMCIKINNVIPM